MSALAIAAAGTAALALRPVGAISVLTTGLVGVAGVLAAGGRERRALHHGATIGVGLLAVVGARAAGAPTAVEATVFGIFALVVAAVAEEAFFRGACYRLLAGRAGAVAAVAITAVAFAAIHVPAYGPGVLAIDLAAGAVLGWQRWASGTWVVPAITHVIANLMQLG